MHGDDVVAGDDHLPLDAVLPAVHRLETPGLRVHQRARDLAPLAGSQAVPHQGVGAELAHVLRALAAPGLQLDDAQAFAFGDRQVDPPLQSVAARVAPDLGEASALGSLIVEDPLGDEVEVPADLATKGVDIPIAESGRDEVDA